MKHYELTYLISSKLSEEEIKGINEKISSLIQEKEGILGDFKNYLKKKLTPAIKKERMAYLISLVFHLDVDRLKDLEKKLNDIPEILRFLIINKKVVKVKAMKERILTKIKTTQKPVAEEEKVEIADIEKKLEEILGGI